MKREVPVEQAVGLRLAHDLTQIVPGAFKGVAFRKGHVIAAADIPRLLDMGKRHVYVLELPPDELHEDDAALRMAQAIAGPGIRLSEPHEGKVILKAVHPGMLWVDADVAFQINMLDDLSLTTRAPFSAVQADQSVAGVRPIPLTLPLDKLRKMEDLVRTRRVPVDSGPPAADPPQVVDVLPFLPQRIAVVTTGSEVQAGRVTDKFGPVLADKFAAFGMELFSRVLVGDDAAEIAEAIRQAIAAGATLVCVTGGMSVDPDDRTPLAIRSVADEVVTHGTPLLPGSMLMLARAGRATIFGLPGAVIFDPLTAFDILLPRALAGWRITKADIARHGAGGWLNV